MVRCEYQHLHTDRLFIYTSEHLDFVIAKLLRSEGWTKATYSSLLYAEETKNEGVSGRICEDIDRLKKAPVAATAIWYCYSTDCADVSAWKARRFGIDVEVLKPDRRRQESSDGAVLAAFILLYADKVNWSSNLAVAKV